MDIQEILNKISQGIPLNDSEQAFYDNYTTKQQGQAWLDNLTKTINQSNLSQKEKEELRQKLIFNRDLQASDVNNLSQMGLDVGKIAYGLSQIYKGKDQLRQLESNRPELSTFQRSQELEQRLNEANIDRSQGLSQASRSLYERQILDDALKGEQMAAKASMGQVGIYGALQQAQAAQRAKAALGLVQLNEQSKMDKNKVYDTLLAQRLNESDAMKERRDADTIRKQTDWKGNLQGARALQNVGTENVMNVLEMQPYRMANYAQNYYNRDAQTNPNFFNQKPVSTPPTNYSFNPPNITMDKNQPSSPYGHLLGNEINNYLKEVDIQSNPNSYLYQNPLQGFEFKYGIKKII